MPSCREFVHTTTPFAPVLLAPLLVTSLCLTPTSAEPLKAEVQASSTAVGSARGAVDGDRLSVDAGSLWKGQEDAETWWWQIGFDKPRAIGAILQINGDHPGVLRNAARDYVWQTSSDGTTWNNLERTETKNERRLYRVHRLAKATTARFLRLQVFAAEGKCPALREVEFYADRSAKIDFPDWLVVVSTAENSTLPRGTGLFVNLARQCEGWESVPVQQVWIGSFNEEFVAAEPHPLCAFFTGNSLEWCQRTREPWRGVQEVLGNRNLPMWGACGGAQVLAILQETGVDRPWDCPRCRDPNNPKSPVYSHIGHTAEAECGDYSKNIGERGKFNMRRVAADPAFEGLPEVFEIMESHIGQIAYLPKGWTRVVTKGPGAHTVNQCIRVSDRPIYAAQFHMELPGTPENSCLIMSNFLKLARVWGGYNPHGKPLPAPKPFVPEKAE